MARNSRMARKPKDDDGGVIAAKDPALARKIYMGDIKPAVSKAREHMQEAATGYKAIKKQAHIQPQAAKLAFKLAEMEDAKRDDFLRCLGELLKQFNIDVVPRDLIDAMQPDDGYARPGPALVSVPQSDGTETDLADAAGDEFTEMSEDELAGQDGRKPSPDEDAEG